MKFLRKVSSYTTRIEARQRASQIGRDTPLTPDVVRDIEQMQEKQLQIQERELQKLRKMSPEELGESVKQDPKWLKGALSHMNHEELKRWMNMNQALFSQFPEIGEKAHQLLALQERLRKNLEQFVDHMVETFEKTEEGQHDEGGTKTEQQEQSYHGKGYMG